MKTMLLAAVAALSLGVGATYAGANEGEGTAANTRRSPSVVGAPEQTAQPEQNAPPVAVTPRVRAPNEREILLYTTGSRGMWLFAPNQNEGTNS